MFLDALIHLICRSVFRELKKHKFCKSALWLSFTNQPRSHCMHLVVEGVTVDGECQCDNEEPVNVALERELIFPLYSGKHVLNKILWLENRVFESHRLNPTFYFKTTLQDIRILPLCGLCTPCGLFQLTIDDWIQLQQNKIIEMTSKTIERFEHTF